MIVWVLVIWVGGSYGGGPMVVDNLADLKGCRALAAAIRATDYGIYVGASGAKCIAVRKVAR